MNSLMKIQKHLAFISNQANKYYMQMKNVKKSKYV